MKPFLSKEKLMAANSLKPKKKRKGIPEMKMLAVASSVGLAMVFSLLFGVAGGYYLDKWLGTKPWFFLAGILVGLFAAFNNLIILTRRLERQRTEIYGDAKNRGKSGEESGKDGNP